MEVVGVTVDEDLAAVPPFVEKYQIKYPILVSGFNPNSSAEGMSLPTTFLYDKNGPPAKNTLALYSNRPYSLTLKYCHGKRSRL